MFHIWQGRLSPDYRRVFSLDRCRPPMPGQGLQQKAKGEMSKSACKSFESQAIDFQYPSGPEGKPQWLIMEYLTGFRTGALT